MAENPLTPPTPSLTHFNLEFEDRVKISQLLLGWRDGVGGGGGGKRKRERERDAPGPHPEGIQELRPPLPPPPNQCLGERGLSSQMNLGKGDTPDHPL